MSRTTKSLSGPALAKYLSEVVDAEAALSPTDAQHLSQTLIREISYARVRTSNRQRRTQVQAAEANPTAVAALSPSAAPSPLPAKLDPYAFSTVVIFTKGGREALLERLQAIATKDDLLAIARTQHLGLSEGFDSLQALREAIVDGTQRRIANRRAAAS